MPVRLLTRPVARMATELCGTVLGDVCDLWFPAWQAVTSGGKHDARFLPIFTASRLGGGLGFGLVANPSVRVCGGGGDSAGVRDDALPNAKGQPLAALRNPIVQTIRPRDDGDAAHQVQPCH